MYAIADLAPLFLSGHDSAKDELLAVGLDVDGQPVSVILKFLPKVSRDATGLTAIRGLGWGTSEYIASRERRVNRMRMHFNE